MFDPPDGFPAVSLIAAAALRTWIMNEQPPMAVASTHRSSRIKQYHKEGRALRTETSIKNTRDFGIGKHLRNLPALRTFCFQTNRLSRRVC